MNTWDIDKIKAIIGTAQVQVSTTIVELELPPEMIDDLVSDAVIRNLALVLTRPHAYITRYGWDGTPGCPDVAVTMAMEDGVLGVYVTLHRELQGLDVALIETGRGCS